MKSYSLADHRGNASVRKLFWALVIAGVGTGLVAHGQTTFPPGDTPVTVQGTLIVEPEPGPGPVESVLGTPGGVPRVVDNGDGTFTVITISNEVQVDMQEVTSGGVTLTTQGDGFFVAEVEETSQGSYYIYNVATFDDNTLLPVPGAFDGVYAWDDDDLNGFTLGVQTDPAQNSLTSVNILQPDPLDETTWVLDPADPGYEGEVGGLLQIVNVAVAGGNIEADGVLTVGSDANIGGDLGVDGNTVLNGDVGVAGDVHVLGDLTVDGDINGNLTGDVTGDVTGNLTGDVTGNVTGDLTGDVTGNVTGDVTGNVTGNLTGDVIGKHTGQTLITEDEDGVVHIGVNSLLTHELDGTQRLRAENALGENIPIQFDGDEGVIIDNYLLVTEPGMLTTSSSVIDGAGALNPAIDRDTTVVTRLGTQSREDSLTSSGSTYIDNDGNVTLAQGGTTETSIELIHAVKFDIFPLGHAQAGEPDPATIRYIGGYVNDDGMFVEATGEFATRADLEAHIATTASTDFDGLPEPVFAQQVLDPSGGNLSVGGDAAVGGDLEVDGALVLTEQRLNVGDELVDLRGRLDGDRFQAAGGDAQQSGTVAIGPGAEARSVGSIAIGAGAIAQNSVAIGVGAQALGVNSTALGDGAIASGANSVALGANSVANRPNTVSVGAFGAERAITNVAPGTQGTDAVNVNQLTAERDERIREVNRLDGRIDNNARRIARNARAISENRQMIHQNRQAIERLDNKVETVKGKAYSGIAAAATLGTLVSPSEDGRTTLMAGIAHYEGESALGVNATHRLAVGTRSLYLNAGVAVTTDSTVLPRVMAGYEF